MHAANYMLQLPLDISSCIYCCISGRLAVNLERSKLNPYFDAQECSFVEFVLLWVKCVSESYVSGTFF